MTATRTGLRSVPDTNVLLAAKLSKAPTSPNAEYLERWQNEEFVLLYSSDTYFEYIAVLLQIPVDRPGE